MGNVVQSIPFVDGNRDDHVQLHPSGSRISIAPIRYMKLDMVISICINEGYTLHREATVLLRRTVGNVVQSIFFVDANREDHVQLHPSGSRISIVPLLDRKISSPLVAA